MRIQRKERTAFKQALSGVNRRGVALILTLLIVGLLSASVISFIKATHLEAKMADNMFCFTQAEILAQAGLKGAMTVLAMDDSDVDGLTDTWAGFPTVAAMAGSLFEEGSITGSIEDLSSRFNPNYLIDDAGLLVIERQEQLERILTLLEIETSPIPALLDWLDTDDVTRTDGAENQYYLSLNSPYPCANGEISTLGQLSLIAGLTREILYGTEQRTGLVSFLTVNSDGYININTASEEMLMCLDDDLTQAVAQEIMERRAAASFQKLDDLSEISGLTPEIRARIIGFLSVSSSHFLIKVEGNFREARVAVTAIVERDDEGVKLIYYKVG